REEPGQDRDAGEGRPDARARRHLRDRAGGELAARAGLLEDPGARQRVPQLRHRGPAARAADLRHAVGGDAGRRGRRLIRRSAGRRRAPPPARGTGPAGTSRIRTSEAGWASACPAFRVSYTARAMADGTIWLVGAMGAGKSAVGPRLAARLGLPFVDADAEIERAAGASIAAIFEREGEASFRARERAAIEAQAGRAAVVALGGGAIAQPGAAERLAATGTVVWLRARPETLAARVGDGAGRPLLASLAPDERRARIAALLAE